MFCPRCGTDNPDDGRYCRKCGVGLEAVAYALDAGRPSALSADNYAGEGARCRAERARKFTTIGMLALVGLVAAASFNALGSGGGIGLYVWIAIFGCVVIPAGLKFAMRVGRAVGMHALATASRRALIEAATTRELDAAPNRVRLGAEGDETAEPTTRRMEPTKRDPSR